MSTNNVLATELGKATSRFYEDRIRYAYVDDEARDLVDKSVSAIARSLVGGTVYFLGREAARTIPLTCRAVQALGSALTLNSGFTKYTKLFAISLFRTVVAPLQMGLNAIGSLLKSSSIGRNGTLLANKALYLAHAPDLYFDALENQIANEDDGNPETVLSNIKSTLWCNPWIDTMTHTFYIQPDEADYHADNEDANRNGPAVTGSNQSGVRANAQELSQIEAIKLVTGVIQEHARHLYDRMMESGISEEEKTTRAHALKEFLDETECVLNPHKIMELVLQKLQNQGKATTFL